jgi:hypothetical protein
MRSGMELVEVVGGISTDYVTDVLMLNRGLELLAMLKEALAGARETAIAAINYAGSSQRSAVGDGRTNARQCGMIDYRLRNARRRKTTAGSKPAGRKV